MKFFRSGPLLTVAVVVVVIARGHGVGGLVGALGGLLLELASFQVGTLLGVLLWRLRVRYVIFGVGRELRAWSTPRLRIALCALPVVIRVGARSVRSPVRLRLWLTGLTSALVAVGVVVGAWLVGPFGVAVGATACLAHELWPRRSAATTSPGWYVFSLPRVSGREAAEMEATPLVSAVVDAVHVGDLAAADTALAVVVAAHPDLVMTTGAQAAVHTAAGRYVEALQVLGAVVGRDDLADRDRALLMASMAGATASAAEVGLMPASVGVPAAARAVDVAIGFGLPRYRLLGTLAQLALLRGDAAEAVRMGRDSADGSGDALGRADALATVARGLMAGGDNAAARAVLAEASELAAWLPRVAGTAARLDVS
ncbi:hypothetical protein ACFFQW_07365 [Umezawaea endophytica]|uniref:Uncharacterized protein n=1 Tax=Umezawaea endophytica TaxID=1654476 RepID=A0A9X2VPU1_9PSEU|nr:hypothetical protein [Umezawaea endophytica]MCS7480084.1 hypothetical protein [Umezawaea endophytica]